MKRIRTIMREVLVLFLFFLSCKGWGQDTLILDLNNVLAFAIEQAIDLKIAQSQKVRQDYEFQRADQQFSPQLFLEATLPNLNRSIESRPLPDGTDAFVNRSTMYNNIGLALNYQLEKTGGLLRFGSNLERLDIFQTDRFDQSTTYFFRPIQISYTHPLFSFNELKWEKERLSLLYLEFKEEFARVREDIIIDGISLFRQVYNAQQKINLDKEKIMETDSLLRIKNRLHDIGKTTRAELLRLDLAQKNNYLALEEDLVNWQQAQVELADFIGIDREDIIWLKDPPKLRNISIDVARAQSLAIQNDYVQSNYRRRLREAEANQERAAKDRDIELNLNLSLGLNNSTDNLRNIFSPLLDREIFSLSIRAPITGHERYELARKIAEESARQEELAIEKEKQELSRTAYNLIIQFELLKNTLNTKEDAYNTSEEILALTRQQFLLGNNTYSEMTLAEQDREEALLQYYQTLMDIHRQYYEIRRLCMYDFINNQPVSN